MPIPPGTRLGPYEITAPAGSGGMGEVYRARDTRLDRTVALKILPSEFSRDPRLRGRFEREAKLVSSLSHPNICTLHDVGEHDGRQYLVMEYLEGETLAQRLLRGPLPMDQVLSVGMQVASALQRAHRQGVVHRDLKPGNVMLTRSGAKLLDFGLAKDISPLAVAAAAPTLAHGQEVITEEGTLLGTWPYMSPEQVEGREADARSDIFALGALLYEMATARRAFDGRSRTGVIAAILQGQPVPPSTIQPLVPPGLERLIATCLEKEPDDRVQTAHDVLLQLRWVAEGGSAAGLAAPVVRRRTRRERLIWGSAAAAGMLLAGAAGWSIPRGTAAPAYSFTIPSVDAAYDRSRRALISPDGSRLAFIARDTEGRRWVWVRPLADLRTEKLPGTEGADSIFWSPDGQSLAFVVGRRLFRQSAAGGPAHLIADVQVPGEGDWSDRGVIVMSQADAALVRIDLASGRIEPASVLNTGEHEIGHHAPVFLPDGRRFLYVASTRNPALRSQVHRLYAGSLDSREAQYLGPISSSVAFSAPDTLLFVREGTLLAQGFDPKTLRLSGEPRMVVDEINHIKPTGVAAFSVSRNGTLVVRATGKPSRLFWLGADGRLGDAAGPPNWYGSLRVSPDGRRLLLAIHDTRTATPDLWIRSLDRDTAQRLTFDDGWENRAVWSADGTRVYYAADRQGYPDVYDQAVDGPAEGRLLLSAQGLQLPQDASPDGRFLLYSTDEDPQTGEDLYVVPLAGGAAPRPFVKLPMHQTNARFSPDGRLVAYVSDETGARQVYIRGFPAGGAAHQISIAEGTSPRWSRDGRTIYYIAGRRVMAAAVDREGRARGEPVVFAAMPYDVFDLEPLPDGRFVVELMSEGLSATPHRVFVNWRRLIGP